jgi:hypothetical protein
MKVRKFDEQKERVETGPIQFGSDWPGIFIRGDNALHYAFLLEMFINGQISQGDSISKICLRSLLSDLCSCDERTMKKE